MNDSSVQKNRTTERDLNYLIDNFVKEIIKSDQSLATPPNEPEDSFVDYCYQFLINTLGWFSIFFQAGHRFSPNIEAFWHGCEATGITQGRMDDPVTSDYENYITKERTKCLINWIKAHHNSSYSFQGKLKQFDERHRSDELRLLTFAAYKFNKLPKTLVVRLDLLLNEDIDQISNVFLYHRAFLRNYLNNPIFEGMVGYVWSVKQNPGNGYWIQCAFLFDGEECEEGSFIGDQIGNLWRISTDNDGSFINRNEHAEYVSQDPNDFNGVGMIHRDNPVEFKNAIDGIRFLAATYSDEYLLSIPFHHKALGIVDI